MNGKIRLVTVKIVKCSKWVTNLDYFKGHEISLLGRSKQSQIMGYFDGLLLQIYNQGLLPPKKQISKSYG